MLFKHQRFNNCLFWNWIYISSFIRSNKINKLSLAQNNNYNKYLEEKYQYFILGKLAFHEKDKKNHSKNVLKNYINYI